MISVALNDFYRKTAFMQNGVSGAVEGFLCKARQLNDSLVMGRLLIRNEWVVGSILTGSSKKFCNFKLTSAKGMKYYDNRREKNS